MNWVIMPFVENYTDTEQALADLLDQTIPDLRVLLIDNGSKAQTPAAFTRDPRVLLWRYKPALLSLSTVWNTALEMVWKTGGQHALVVNNDVRLPKRLYADLLEAQEWTAAWFVSACNVGEAWYDGMMGQSSAITESLLASRGGPDFSCFLITAECHRYFQFDERFIPAYFEDNDYHRRLQLAGLGDKIFSLPIPYLHYGSGTLRNVERLNQGWHAKFEACKRYYSEKWGGVPGQETHTSPFGERSIFLDAPTRVYTGQGRPGYYMGGDLPWANSAT